MGAGQVALGMKQGWGSGLEPAPSQRSLWSRWTLYPIEATNLILSPHSFAGSPWRSHRLSGCTSPYLR